MRKSSALSLILISILFFQNCTTSTQSSSDGNKAADSSYYFSKMKNLKVSVFYEPGAEPFVGSGAGGRPYWGVLQENLDAIFQYRSKAPNIEVPLALNEMSALPAQSRADWTTEQIMQLHEQYEETASSGEAIFHIYFLNGYYKSNAGVQAGVIGVNITGETVIAIFKDVVESTGAHPNGAVPKFVEQSTLVHEMGHALGLVNIGVPLTSSHQDVNHGAHTDNQDCVMYYANEGITDLQQFVLKFVSSNSREMWGPEVLADVKAISE